MASIVRMYCAPKEHNPPHIHVYYQDDKAIIDINKCELVEGGYMTFLNDYGGGPESYEGKVYDHLKNYLLLLIDISDDKEELENELLGVEQYLSQHSNMYNDHLFELYEDLAAKYIQT